MCEPLSVAASVLAVAGFAVKSCECLHKTLRLFSEAPEDLQHHITAVQALQSTFAGIAALEKDASNAALIMPEFKARLHACMLDLQAMERLAKSIHAQLEEGRVRRIWAKVKIRRSLADQRQTLKSHLSRIKSYNMTISLDLLLLNTRLGLRPTNKNPSIQEKCCHPPGVPVDQRIRSLDHSYSLQSPQGYYSEHMSLRSSVLKCLENDLLRFLLWLGPITVQQWHNSQSVHSDVLKSSHGYGIALATASTRYRPFRLELAVFLRKNLKGPSANFSIHWNLFWPRIVPWETDIIDLALCGDVSAMKEKFSTGHSTPFDVLPNGMTLLHLAASEGHFDMVKFLLQEGARVNAMNDFGETPLHSAIALSKNYNVSRIILENGGDLHNQNADGKTPLHTFPSQVSEQILRCHEYLLDFSARDHRGMSLLHYLAWSSKTSNQTFRRYHERSSLDLRTVDAEGRSMLHLAAQRGNVPLVNYLAYAVKDFNINHSDSRGRTVLHYGVESKRACDTITALISHGADIWARDCHERSALHHAAKLGNLPAVKTLLALGMTEELRAADCFGMIPLKIAAYYKAHAVLEFLAQMESRWEWGKHLTGSRLVECRDPFDDEMHSLLGTSLLSPAQTRHDALLVRPRQKYDWFNGGWKSLLRTLQRPKRWLSNPEAYFSVIKHLAVTVVIWTLVVFLYP